MNIEEMKKLEKERFNRDRIKDYNKTIQLSDSALLELKEALYLEIGDTATEFTKEHLNSFGNFILTVVAISYKMKAREMKKKNELN